MQEDSRIVVNYIIDSVLTKYESYSICGNLFYEFNDSILKFSLNSLPDSILNEEDIDGMVYQYSLYAGYGIEIFVDTVDFIKILNIDDFSNEEFYKLHFAIAPPLFTKEKMFCIVYLHYYLNKSGQNGIFLVFKKDVDKWELKYPMVVKDLRFSEGYHYHNYTLVQYSR